VLGTMSGWLKLWSDQTVWFWSGPVILQTKKKKRKSREKNEKNQGATLNSEQPTQPYTFTNHDLLVWLDIYPVLILGLCSGKHSFFSRFLAKNQSTRIHLGWTIFPPSIQSLKLRALSWASISWATASVLC
jgi:hypothetical protein